MNRRNNVDNAAFLRALARGGCIIGPAKTPVNVIVTQAEEQPAACTSGAPDGVLLDSSKFDKEDCPVLEYEITNNSETETYTLVIGGGPAGTGDFARYGTEPSAADTGDVTSDDGEAGGPQQFVQALQFLGMKGNMGGIVFTGANVEVGENPDGLQANERFYRNFIGLDRSECKSKVVKRICNVECGDDETDTLQFDFNILTDLDHYLTYDIHPGTTITLEMFYAGYGADNHIISPCGGGAAVQMNGAV